MASNELALLAGLVFVGFLVEAAAGFGGMVISLTLGALWLPMGTLLGVLVPVNLVLSTYLLMRNVKHVQWRFLARRLVPLMAVGLAAGMAVATATSTVWLKPVFAAFVVVVAAQQLAQLKAGGTPARLSPVVAGAWLLGGGFIHGVFATGGPPTVYVASRELPEKAVFRASLSAVWVLLNLLLLPRLWHEGSLSPGTSVVLLAPLAGGIVVGEWVHRRLDEKQFRVVVAVLLLGAGLTLLVSSLTR
ncbi:MAG: sulfite exporter TauE/SafE family protein [Myxococcaceae bacterium]|nr:sulfite exporter TauE/SafE family protein [Myxococcaceae bacterium]